MRKPIRTTLFFGLLSGILVLTVNWLRVLPWTPPTLFKLAVWVDLAVYAALLARWSRTRWLDLAAPLGLALGVALWPGTHMGFFLLVLGVFAWIRSGICFNKTPLRALAAELVTLAGGLAWVALWNPRSSLAWALAIWLFFLVQTLYFFIVPLHSEADEFPPPVDPFDQARNAAQRLLEKGKAGL